MRARSNVRVSWIAVSCISSRRPAIDHARALRVGEVDEDSGEARGTLRRAEVEHGQTPDVPEAVGDGRPVHAAPRTKRHTIGRAGRAAYRVALRVVDRSTWRF